MTDNEFSLTLNLQKGYAQEVAFDDSSVPSLVIDERPPVGSGEGPNPARVLGAAVGGCLASSLAFCLRKGNVEISGLTTRVRGTLARNERGRMRVTDFHVVLELVVPADQHDRVPRCLGVFEDYCIVTASIRPAIPVEVLLDLKAPPA
jgi:uncharacterized OsmC-like protein